MPKLSELMRDQADLTVPFEGGDLHVVYRPRVVTPEWQRAIGEAEDSPNSDYEAMVYGPLKDALISWDLEREDGTIYELTSEAMATVPRHILTQTLVAVIRTARPNYARLLAPSTDGSSAPSAPAKKARTGTS